MDATVCSLSASERKEWRIAEQLAVVIATKDRPENVRRLLTCLRDEPIRAGQLIVVDAGNGSLRSVVEAFVDLRPEYVHEGQPGLTRQKNTSVRHLGPSIRLVAFLDDDIVLEPGAMGHMVQFWERAPEEVGGASFNIVSQQRVSSPVMRFLLRLFGIDDGRFGVVLRSGFNTPIAPAEATRQVQWLNGGSTVWRRAVVEQCAFDEWFPGSGLCEDVRFSLQVSRQYRLMVVAEARARHLEIAKTFAREYRQGQAQVMNRMYVVRSTSGLSPWRCGLALGGLWMLNLLLGLTGRGRWYWARAAGNLTGWWRVVRGHTRPFRRSEREAPDGRVRVVYVHPTLEIGGAEELRLTLLKHLDPARYDIRLCCLERKGAIGEELEANGYPIAVLGRSARTGSFTTTWALYQFLKRHPADIVQTSLFYGNWHGRIAARLAGVPVVIAEEHSLHDQAADHLRYSARLGPIFRLADRQLARWTDRIIACSQAVADSIRVDERIPAEKFLVLLNVIDGERFVANGTRAVARHTLGFRGGEIVCGSVGTLKPVKGMLELVEAFAKARTMVPALRLLLVGDGSLRSLIESAIREWGLTAWVTMTGARRDISYLLSAMDVFVSASRSEGFGINLLEAMAMGLPCIAPRIGGIQEVVVEDQTGLLVPPGDCRALAEAIVALARDSERARAFGSAGRTLARERFQPSGYVMKLTGLYEMLLREKRTRHASCES